VKRIVAVVSVVAAAALAIGLALFEPWRLFTSSHLDEPAPTSSPAAVAATPSPAATGSAVRKDVVLATGTFVDAEHDTSGTARILQLADGRRFLRLEQLASSDGPDLHVWLSDAKSGGDWGSYDDGVQVKLGHLKATHGNQNYPIPADAALSEMRSVVIWCDRFNVAFGTAPIRLG
jgi:hypothetical protein